MKDKKHNAYNAEIIRSPGLPSVNHSEIWEAESSSIYESKLKKICRKGLTELLRPSAFFSTLEALTLRCSLPLITAFPSQLFLAAFGSKSKSFTKLPTKLAAGGFFGLVPGLKIEAAFSSKPILGEAAFSDPDEGFSNGDGVQRALVGDEGMDLELVDFDLAAYESFLSIAAVTAHWDNEELDLVRWSAFFSISLTLIFNLPDLIFSFSEPASAESTLWPSGVRKLGDLVATISSGLPIH